MPFVGHNGARIHWSSLGQGEPVVLVMGLGCSSAMWFRVAPRLARTHRVLLLDNRGSGQTHVAHFVVHRVSHMAADVAAVLDAAGEASAHLVGFSMGGMIAQQFAIDFPQRVRSLALLGTHSGGAWATQADAPVRRLLFDKATMDPQHSLRAMRPYTYARETSDALFDEDALVRLANQPTTRDYQAQLYALIGWSAYLELPRFACPTLVMHGLQDRLIPPANARRTAERIPGARLIELPEASHWLMTDQNAQCLQALCEHIDAHSETA
jgi:pimeloyl-ACP methyl ester carboxylesterase